MLNRSAIVIGHEPAFYGWLKTTGLAEQRIDERQAVAERMVYLIPACELPDELEEVIEDLFEEIFRRELTAWQPEQTHWPDTADFTLFTRWFTVESFAMVDDVGRGAVGEEAPS
jgi:hypothetical protein